uniref:Uncharacterized protein n=1 Tax=Rhizophora mucronata TaxID=61149 RepID=A0A2P2NIQ7_RHIMU
MIIILISTRFQILAIPKGGFLFIKFQTMQVTP